MHISFFSYIHILDKTRDTAERIIQLDILRHIMIVTKPGEQKLIVYTKQLITWLIESYHQIHVIDCNYMNEMMIKDLKSRLHFWDANDVKPDNIDLIITLEEMGQFYIHHGCFKMTYHLYFHLIIIDV